MDTEDEEFIASLGITDAQMRTTATALNQMASGFVEDQINSWADVYQVLQEGIGYMGHAMQKGAPKEPDEILRLTVASLVIKAYVLFRRSQPTMTDFDLAKIVILHNVENEVIRAENIFMKHYHKE